VAAEFACYPSLRGRAVFITGGATGIGAEFAREFCAQGARVGIADIQDAAAGELAATIEQECGIRPWYRRCDVTDAASLQAAIAAFAVTGGPVEVLVNNAASDERRAFGDVTPQFWDDMIAVNLRAFFFAAQAAAPGMRERGRGSIINLGSITWRAGFAG